MATPLAQADVICNTSSGGREKSSKAASITLCPVDRGLYALERAQQLLTDPTSVERPAHDRRELRTARAWGVLEAPRGTLIHHYWVDEKRDAGKGEPHRGHGGHNNPCHEPRRRGSSAEHFPGGAVTEGMLNRVEMGDPGLRPMPVVLNPCRGSDAVLVEVRGPKNELLEQHQRPSPPA